MVTMPWVLETEKILGSVPPIIILDWMTFSEPRTIPSLHTAPRIVLLTKLFSANIELENLRRCFNGFLSVFNLEDSAF